MHGTKAQTKHTRAIYMVHTYKAVKERMNHDSTDKDANHQGHKVSG